MVKSTLAVLKIRLACGESLSVVSYLVFSLGRNPVSMQFLQMLEARAWLTGKKQVERKGPHVVKRKKDAIGKAKESSGSVDEDLQGRGRKGPGATDGQKLDDSVCGTHLRVWQPIESESSEASADERPTFRVCQVWRAQKVVGLL